jgi:ATP/maltotriose-dependent transcriptional regulator MalT/DNA-binding SARP family transcriptional activator
MAGSTAAKSVVLRRARLETRLDDAFGKRLTLITAGAGYGKSTLVAEWTADVVSAWHTATGSDRRLSSFAAGIAELIRPVVGDPAELVATLTSADDELGQAETLAARLSEALEPALDHDLVLIVDDAHELASSPPSLRLIESLCRQGPAGLRVLLLSREELDLRVDRLRAQGLVLEVTSSELAFTADEVEELVAARLGPDPGLSAVVFEATRGWPAAARLAIEAAGEVPGAERERTLRNLVRRPGSPLFAFLAHEVFERQSPDVQGLIRTVAPFDSFSPELCEELGVARANEVIDMLVQRGLFVRGVGDAFTLHALIREYAQAAWPLTEEERRSILFRAAEWFATEGRIDSALTAFAAASAQPDVARLLDLHGPGLIASGHADTVLRLADGLPSEVRTPAVERLIGDALLIRSDYESAIAAFERAAPSFGPIDAGLAWRLGMAHHYRGDLARAIDSYSRAEPAGDGSDDALLLAWSASSRGLSADLEEAAPLAERALDVAKRSGDDRALAAANVAASLVAAREGRKADEERHLDVALGAAERSGDRIMLSRIHTNRAAALTQRGRYRAALVELDEAFRASAAPGLKFFERTLKERATAHFRLGLLDEAAADFTKVVELSQKSGSTEAGVGLAGLGDVHRERGNLVLARIAYEDALARIEQDLNPDLVAPTLCGLARALVDDEPSRARALAERAVPLRWDYPAAALTTVGWLALAAGEGDEAAASSAAAVTRAREQRDRYSLAEALELDVFAREEPATRKGQLEEALAIWRELESRVRIAECELGLAGLTAGAEARAAEDRAKRRLRALGVRISATGPAGLLRTIATPAHTPLAVQVLGGFTVLRDGVPVPLSEWQTKKPRELLKILVCRRGRPVPREVVMDALWPSEDPQKLTNRLSVALSTLRTVLDPERRFAADHFVRADRDSIAINLAAVLVDVEVFLHEADTGLSLRSDARASDAEEWLAQAESAYAGDVLEEDPYSEWAVSLREEARATYISVAHALARDAAAAGRHEDALRYFLRILTRDSYDEGAHLGVVSTLERLGRKGEARRTYRAYVARMGEIGAAPAAFPSA